ncbi:hypothetical protein DD865_13415, partial [Staphylococcus pseudintermedius]
HNKVTTIIAIIMVMVFSVTYLVVKMPYKKEQGQHERPAPFCIRLFTYIKQKVKVKNIKAFDEIDAIF